MSKITTISIDIETDKLPEFYISLVLHKIKPTGDTEALKALADAMHFDYTALLKKLELEEAKQKHLDRAMLEIHAFLYNSKRDAKGYLEVSKESLTEFEASEFGKEVKNKFYLMELSTKLKNLEEYLNINHHLPGIQSATEMQSSDGVALGKLNSQLLQKVEELTLYILQQQKQMEDLQKKMTDLESKINSQTQEKK